jgi:hypothetical protein
MRKLMHAFIGVVCTSFVQIENPLFLAIVFELALAFLELL